jgi:hypothetical protein
MRNFKCTLTDQGIHIQGEALNANGENYLFSLLIAAEEVVMTWKDAMVLAKGQGKEWNLPTLTQWILINDHLDEINEVLRNAKLSEITRLITCEDCNDNLRGAFNVGLSFGYVGDDEKFYFPLRAVSAFPAAQRHQTEVMMP